MSDVTFILLYVEDVARSAAFYSRLLGKPVPESSPNFAIIPAAPGLMLGLWRRGEVEPAARAEPGAGEIAVTLADEAALEAAHARWSAEGVAIAQKRRRAWISATPSSASIPTATASAPLRRRQVKRLNQACAGQAPASPYIRRRRVFCAGRFLDDMTDAISDHYKGLAAIYTDAIRASDFKANIVMFFLSLTMGPVVFNRDKFPQFLTLPVVITPFLHHVLLSLRRAAASFPQARAGELLHFRQGEAGRFPLSRPQPKRSAGIAAARGDSFRHSLLEDAMPARRVLRLHSLRARGGAASGDLRAMIEELEGRAPRDVASFGQGRGGPLSQRRLRLHRDDPAQRLQGQCRHRIRRHHDGAGHLVPRQAAEISAA